MLALAVHAVELVRRRGNTKISANVDRIAELHGGSVALSAPLGLVVTVCFDGPANGTG